MPNSIIVPLGAEFSLEQIRKSLERYFRELFDISIIDLVSDKRLITYYKARVSKTYTLSDDDLFVLCDEDEDFMANADNLLEQDFKRFVANYHFPEDYFVYCVCNVPDHSDKNIEILKQQLAVVEEYVKDESIRAYFEIKNEELSKNFASFIYDLSERYHQVDINEGSIKNVCEAQEKADMLVDYIVSLNLSPFEQFLLVHDFCAGKPYHKKENGEYNCRAFIDNMATDQIVCAGYARLMQVLCGRLGIQCEYVSGIPKDEDTGHAFNMVHLVDSKYNIDGVYLCDACWDSELSKPGLRDYTYAAFPIQDLKNDEHNIYYDKDLSRNNDKAYEKYPTYSQPIPFDTFEKALFNAYDRLNDSEYNREFITQSLDETIKNNPVGENCFAQKFKEQKAINQLNKSR